MEKKMETTIVFSGLLRTGGRLRSAAIWFSECAATFLHGQRPKGLSRTGILASNGAIQPGQCILHLLTS